MKKTAEDAVIRGEIEVSGNTEASYPDETNGRTPERKTEIFLDNSDDVSLTLTNSYQFETKDNNETSALISQYTSTVAPTGGTSASTTYLYKYDANGNITEIRNQANTLLYRYAYDMKGQLIREDNQPLNRTYFYTYDDAGNILTSVSYVFNPEVEDFTGYSKKTNRAFTYDASGRITKFKGAIVYDAIGNPVIYRGKTLTWQNGRQLASYEDYSFTYNADGIRIGKTNGTVTNEYILNGSQVMRQIIDNGTTTYVADYIYHENGTPLAFAYYEEGGTPAYYFYDLNLQGDIIGIYDENGSKVVGFRYDAWGSFNTDISNATVCTDTFLRALLFRYRSYIYDYETDLYYLQSRYYDPEIGRFINADGYVNANGDLIGYNMYAYCSNNPVNRVDSTGEFWIAALIVTAVVVCAATLFGCSNKEIYKPYSGGANCYAYALKLEFDPETGRPFDRSPQPGTFSGDPLDTWGLIGDESAIKDAINTRVSADARQLGLTYTEVENADHVPKEGNWVIALAYSSTGEGYHWYRRDEDGMWSHKLGIRDIRMWDASAKRITDPANCDRGVYDIFMGYYEVGPNGG